jgi:hypothetical protein
MRTVTLSLRPDSLRDGWRFVGLGVAALLLLACSRKTSPGVATTGSSVGAAKVSAPLCLPAGKDLQAVRFDVDAKFIADHDAMDVLDPIWWSGDIYDSHAAAFAFHGIVHIPRSTLEFRKKFANP